MVTIFFQYNRNPYGISPNCTFVVTTTVPDPAIVGSPGVSAQAGKGSPELVPANSS